MKNVQCRPPGYSLSGAIDEFGSNPEKMEHEPTGLVTEKEISYARQDVRATLGLLNALKCEYELHPIPLRPDHTYSPASIGKAYLRTMGIVEPMRKFKNIPARIHGIAMARRAVDLEKHHGIKRLKKCCIDRLNRHDKSGLEHLFAIASYDSAADAGFGLGMTKVRAPPKTMVFPRV